MYNVDSILSQNINNIIIHSEFQASAGSASYSNSQGGAEISSWNGLFNTPIMNITSSNNGQATYNNDELTRISNQVTLPIENGILDIQISGSGWCPRSNFIHLPNTQQAEQTPEASTIKQSHIIT